MPTPLSITLSTPQLEHLGISPQSGIEAALECGFAHIRLGVYWNRVERLPGEYDFREVRALLAQCEKNHQSVVLTVGVKAPRWPEYYWPDFIAVKNPEYPKTQEQLLRFLQKTVTELQSFSCITHWQVENEPFDPSGPEHLTISRSCVEQEIAAIRHLDARPILLTVWGNALVGKDAFPTAAALADVVGIDVYYAQFRRQFLGRSLYAGPADSDQRLAAYPQSSPKPIWITELQAEPWEKDEASYRAPNPASMSPAKLHTFIVRAQRLPVTEIFLWGFEYWLWRAKEGDRRYLEMLGGAVM